MCAGVMLTRVVLADAADKMRGVNRIMHRFWSAQRTLRRCETFSACTHFVVCTADPTGGPSLTYRVEMI
jgi:hypothetical protein